jgi:hypothetical protein
MEGGACVIFAWGYSVMMKLARDTDVELTIDGNSFVLMVKQQQHEIQARKGFSVTTNCKSIHAWTSHEILTVSDVLGLTTGPSRVSSDDAGGRALGVQNTVAAIGAAPSLQPESSLEEQPVHDTHAALHTLHGGGLSHETVVQQIEALQAIRPALPSLDRQQLTSLLEECEYSTQRVLNQLLETESKETMHVKIVAFGEGPYGLLLKEQSMRSVGKGATVFGFADKTIADANDINIGDMIVSINLGPVVGIPFKALMLRLRTVPRPVFLGFRTFL